MSDTGSDWVEVTAAPGAESMDQMSEGDAAEQERRGEEEEEEEEEGGHELDVVVEDVYDGWGEVCWVGWTPGRWGSTLWGIEELCRLCRLCRYTYMVVPHTKKRTHPCYFSP